MKVAFFCRTYSSNLAEPCILRIVEHILLEPVFQNEKEILLYFNFWSTACAEFFCVPQSFFLFRPSSTTEHILVH